MPTLRELQLAFTEAVLGREGEFDRHLRVGGLARAQRLAVYRNSVLENATAALRCAYPVVRRLVGDPFFDLAASEYVRRDPSVSGDIEDLGGNLAGFIAALPAAAGLPYLPDVAVLEWAIHEVSRAGAHDARAEGPRVLIEGRAEDLRFGMHPASRLVASAYPLLRIWETNQPDHGGDDEVDLTEGGVRLLVFRGSDLKVRFHPLRDGEFLLLEGLSKGETVAAASDRAFDADQYFDLAAALGTHLVLGTLHPWSPAPAGT